MAINKVMVGESLVNDNDPTGTMAEIAHIDLLIGPRGSAVETAFCNGLCNNKDGFTSLLAVVGPNLVCKPNTMMFNKVTIKGAKQAVQMFGAEVVADNMGTSVEVVFYILTKKMRNDGSYVTKAAVRKTRQTVRKMKHLCDMYDDLRPPARRAPARRTASKTTLIKN